MLRLDFDRGTLLIHGADDSLREDLQRLGCIYDSRVDRLRAPAYRYRELLTYLHRAELEINNHAGGFGDLSLESREIRKPFPYQAEAVQAWMTRRSGVVVLPTGAGKTFVAQLLIDRLRKSTLVVTPTLDLMHQWYAVMKTAFDREIGLIGGGHYDVEDITITTYDSAYIHMERLGNRFAFLIFDECHHLPGPTYSLAAELSLAPFRLGLTATPEREDGGEARLERLIGPFVYRREIGELAGEFLSEYETVRIQVRLSEAEQEEYGRQREIYRTFVYEEGLRLGSPAGWQRFLQATSRSERGRRAFLAYRAQKAIAQASEAKLRALQDLLRRHRMDRVLIFTSDNATVYKISRQFLIPSITHQTKVKERHRILTAFNEGSYPFLVTSKVLNEGVDVPAANVGVVLSGSGSVREHVQRLGRILRRGKNKQAVLYELVAENTAEEFVSERRRQHGAYQREAPKPTDDGQADQ